MRSDVEGVTNASLPGVVVVRKEVSRYLPATSVFAARGAVGTVVAKEFTRVEVIEDRPREIVAAASVLGRSARSSGSPSPLPAGPVLSIGLVEDHPLFRDGLRHLLTAAGMDVVAVKDPAALRAALAEGRRALDAVAEIRKLYDASGEYDLLRASPGGPRGPVHVVGAQQDVDWYHVSRMGNSAEVQQRIYQRLLREIGVLAGLRCGRVSQVEDLPPERVRVHVDLWVVADREEYLRIMAQAESDRAKVLALEELLRTGTQRVYRYREGAGRRRSPAVLVSDLRKILGGR